MSALHVQIYFMSNSGEPRLSFHACRLIVYVSSFAKPMGIYLTLLFSIERLVVKSLSTSLASLSRYRASAKRLFPLAILLNVFVIVAWRLFDVLRMIKRGPSRIDTTSNLDDEASAALNGSSTGNISFEYCFSSMSAETYANILSFYVLQSAWEYILIVVIILVLIVTIVHQCFIMPRELKSSFRCSVNTKLYFILSLSVVLSELILVFLHFLVDDHDKYNSGTQLPALQFMLFAFNLRCILLPLTICFIICDPCRSLVYDLLAQQSYLENIDEQDQTGPGQDRMETVSPTRPKQRLQDRFRRTFAKRKSKSKEYLTAEGSPGDL